MMLTPLDSSLVLNVLDGAFQMYQRMEMEQGRQKLIALELTLSNERQMFGMRTSVIKDLISALLTQRINAVQHGFDAILSIYADQSHSYIEERQTIVALQFKTMSPLENARIQARLSEIDLNLHKIRKDAGRLYREMNRAIVLIGGAMPIISAETKKALTLPAN